jgi:hypothetical protein
VLLCCAQHIKALQSDEKGNAMPIVIQQTIVTPGADGQDVIQLHISDAKLGDESATLVVQILAKVRPLKMPALAHIQRQAMEIVQDALSPLLTDLARELQEAGYELRPTSKKPYRG